MNEICPNCNHKSLYFREAFGTWRCSHPKCYKEFSKDKTQLRGDLIDSFGNEYKISIKKTKDEIKETRTYFIPKGKTTLKGEFPKLKNNCIFQERQSCNYGIGFERCPYMKYQDENWICTYDKDNTSAMH